MALVVKFSFDVIGLCNVNAGCTAPDGLMLSCTSPPHHHDRPPPVFSPLYARLLTALCTSPHCSMPVSSPLYAHLLTALCPSPHRSMPVSSPLYARLLTALCPSPHHSMLVSSPLYARSTSRTSHHRPSMAKGRSAKYRFGLL